MNIRVEFIAHLREITGTSSVDLDLPAAAVIDHLKGVEELYVKKNLRLLAHNALIKGLLVFKKQPNAGLTRIRDLQESLEAGDTLVIGTGMEGG